MIASLNALAIIGISPAVAIAVFAIMYAAEDYLKAILCVKYYFTYNWLRPVTDQGIKGLEEFYESRRKKPADH